MILSSEDTSVKKLLTPKKGDVDLLNSYENLVMCMVPCNCLCQNINSKEGRCVWYLVTTLYLVTAFNAKNVCGFQIIEQAVGDHICFQYEQALCDLFISPEHI